MSDPRSPLVGVDIGGTKMLMVAQWPDRVVSERVPTGLGMAQDRVEASIRAFLARLPAPPAALGLAVPGLVDERGEVVACVGPPPLLGWRPRADTFGVGCPMIVLNDAEAALLEETRDLAGVSAALVIVGTWVGASFMERGRVLRGARGWSGELGSIPIAAEQGVRPLDALASGAALVGRLGVDGATLAARAAAGDRAILAAIADAGTMLGLGLAGVVNLLNPELLILGGGTAALPGYLDAALDSAERHALPVAWQCCAVRRARAAENVVALGAAHAAAQAAGSPT